MNHKIKNGLKLGKLAAAVGVASLLLTGCGGGGSSSSDDGSEMPQTSSLPAGLTLTMIDSTGPYYYSYQTDTDELTDLNALADSSGDSAVQKLRLTDVSSLGSFVQWPDFRMLLDEERLDGKYLLMKPSYQMGDVILGGTAESPGDFSQLVHFHDTDLAAHSGDEFYGADDCAQEDLDAGTCSGAYYGLQRLNAHIAEQNELNEEVAEALPEGQNLCRAYIDPYQKFEHEQEEAGAEEHAHGALTHFALTDTGRIYFYEEGDSGLVSTQGFVALEGVSSIANCSRTTIARASDDGVIVFIPDTQKLYLVDNHGVDYHQHSVWDMADILPAGEYVDMLAVLGAGAEHDEEHDH